MKITSNQLNFPTIPLKPFPQLPHLEKVDLWKMGVVTGMVKLQVPTILHDNINTMANEPANVKSKSFSLVLTRKKQNWTSKSAAFVPAKLVDP